MLSWRGCSWKNPTGKPGALIRETSTAMTQLGGAAGGMGGGGRGGRGRAVDPSSVLCRGGGELVGCAASPKVPKQ